MKSILYVYGNSEYLFYIFDGMARILSQKEHINGVLNMFAAAGLIYIGFRSVFSGNRDYIGPQIRWLIQYSAIAVFVLSPTTIYIKDVVTNTTKKIDNVPVGLVFPATMISQFGYGMTLEFEKHFTPLNYMPYNKYGTVFASHLMSEFKNMRIKDATLHENMYQFINQCVKLDAMIGTKYTIKELRRSKDIWSHVKKYASSLIRFPYRNPENKTRSTPTCREGSNLIEKDWKEAAKDISSEYIGSIFAKNGHSSEKAGNQLLQQYFQTNLVDSYNFLMGTSAKQPAEKILQQQLMINALSDSAKSFSGVRAAQNQRAGWIIAGELARESLPIMRGLFEAIIYASFIFVLVLAIMPGGWQSLISYFGILCWLQLWAPLYAVLNLVMSLQAKNEMKGFAKSGLTMENMSDITEINGNIAAMAGYYSLAIPLISYGIIKGGSSLFTSLASNITSSTQSIAGSSAAEAVSGNLSLDNRNIDNLQYANSSAFKRDWTARSSQGTEMQHIDGTIEKIPLSGRPTFHSGENITASTGLTRISARDVDSLQLSKMHSDNQSLMESDSTNYTDQTRSAVDNTASWLSQMAQNTSKSDTAEMAKSGQITKSAQKAIDLTRSLHDAGGFTYTEAGRGTLGVSGGIQVPKAIGKLAKKITGMGVTGGISGGYQAEWTNLNENALKNIKDIANKEGYNETMDSVIRGAATSHISDGNSVNKSLTDTINSSYTRAQDLSKAINLRHEYGQNLSDQISKIKSSDVSLDYNARQEFNDYLEARLGQVSGLAAHQLADNPSDPRFAQYYNDWQVSKFQNNPLLKQAERIEHNNVSAEGYKNQQERTFKDKIVEDKTDVIHERAKSEGIDRNDPTFVESNVKERAAKLMDKNDQKIANRQYENQESERKMNEKVNNKVKNRPEN